MTVPVRASARWGTRLVLLLVGAALGLATGADARRRAASESPDEVRPRGGRPRLIFSHEKHVQGLEQDCVTCHLPEADHRVPSMEVCAGCHDAVESESESDCRLCHLDTDLANLKAGESLPRGIGFRPRLWRCVHTRYDHALHASRVRCNVCHPKASQSRTAADVLYPSQRTFRCGLCHEQDPCDEDAGQAAAGVDPKKPEGRQAGAP